MIFLNDEPYRSQETDPLEALASTLAFSADDWGETRAKAWVWGIICGWDEALPEIADRFGWDGETTDRLTALHRRFEMLSTPDLPAHNNQEDA